MRAILEGDELRVLFLGGDFDDGAQRPPGLNESHALFLRHISQDVQVAVGHQQGAENRNKGPNSQCSLRMYRWLVDTRETRDSTLNAFAGCTGGYW